MNKTQEWACAVAAHGNTGLKLGRKAEDREWRYQQQIPAQTQLER